jgi:hypothetical protein
VGKIALHDQVLWHHVPRGGYGFTEHVQAQVIGFTEKRIALLVTTRKPDGQKVVYIKPTRVFKEGERCPGCEIVLVSAPPILPPPCGPIEPPPPAPELRREAEGRSVKR